MALLSTNFSPAFFNSPIILNIFELSFHIWYKIVVSINNHRHFHNQSINQPCILLKNIILKTKKKILFNKHFISIPILYWMILVIYREFLFKKKEYSFPYFFKWKITIHNDDYLYTHIHRHWNSLYLLCKNHVCCSSSSSLLFYY